MSRFDAHYQKYEMFKKDAMKIDISTPLRIEAYFYSAFHLIESIAANKGIHVEKHQKVRKRLEENFDIAGS